MIVLAYLVAIVAANLSVAHFGPASTIVNAFLFIGLDLTARDRLHDAWKTHRILKMGALILAGSVLSYALNRNAGPIAVASCAAFAASASIDALVYSLLHRREWSERANGSNLAGALVDSLVFPTLAFGSLMPAIVLGQFTAKAAGGLVWTLLLARRRRVAVEPA